MSIMKKQIFLLENILRKTTNIYCLILILFLFINSNSIAKEKWIIDQNISKITFEVPVLFARNVFGEFNSIDGFVEIDLENKKNNKALLSIQIDSIVINYEKYRDLLLGPLFFDSKNFPLSVIDTKKFSYKNENELELNIELTLKGISKMEKTKLQIKKLTNDIVQILGTLEFSRTDYNVGMDSWRNTTILKDKIKINSNIFLIRVN